MIDHDNGQDFCVACDLPRYTHPTEAERAAVPGGCAGFVEGKIPITRGEAMGILLAACACGSVPMFGVDMRPAVAKLCERLGLTFDANEGPMQLAARAREVLNRWTGAET